ncbi:conserved hypothetical protein [Cytophaga hutchinsonii ATCC 33406]|uniref:Uncharacterized protein n=2 Tax=Cytophaga hutchinsonii TaxID=985 RepID=A0A6N4SP49_CYTH3|nr:conserved hypothetical protein [Cytophaga hutchinsonii ATCC 33406]SFX13389.1 hypothetical protein SAMN04487930_101643 [Cytophaga hutchinsonii ATCC 33406]
MRCYITVILTNAKEKAHSNMITRLTNVIHKLAAKPQHLFLTDSIGALLTAFLLFVVLRTYNESVGMPERILTYLSIIATVFSIYSAACFLWVKGNFIPFVSVISIANIFYCVLTMILVIRYYPMLTRVGITYFISEILIICVLVYIEVQVAKAIKQHAIADTP